MYELVVCFRYLRPRVSRAYISFNTLISILGIALGVTTLIVVIAVMTGFGNQIRDGFTGFYSHIIIYREVRSGPRRSPVLIDNYPDLLHRIEETEGVTAASPFVRLNVNLVYKGMSYPFYLRGVDPELERRTSTIKDMIVEGEFVFPVVDDSIVDGERDTPGGEDALFGPGFMEDGLETKRISILLGRLIARELLKRQEEMEDEDPVNPSGEKQAGSDLERLGEMKLVSTLPNVSGGSGQRTIWAKVGGIFSFGTIDQDVYIYSSLEAAQRLRGAGPNQVSGISVKTVALSRIQEVKKRLQEKLGPDYRLRTWTELNPDLFEILNQERFIMYLIVALIVAVASLNIISSLSMMVNHKRKEIGILRSLGSKRRSITAIFGLMGAFIGIVGTGLGVVGGLLMSYNFNAIRRWFSIKFGFNLFSVFKTIPVIIRPVDIVVISGIALSLCLLASIYPAWKASRLHPVEALRYE